MKKRITLRQEKILAFLESYPLVSISEMAEMLDLNVSIPSINRDLAKLAKVGVINKIGKGRNTTYRLSPTYHFHKIIDTKTYFQIEPDERKVFKTFNVDIFNLLESEQVFTNAELKFLDELTNTYQFHLEDYPETLYNKEFERLTIELSWKSAQIEGNTYDLLDTEQLLKYKIESNRNTKEEAIMLLNHKYALDYLRSNPDLFNIVRVKDIEDVHSILTKDLGVARNIRSRLVGITGTQYRPPDNSFQIREFLENMSKLLNQKDSFFEKALLSNLLISYIQPFEDGNKRTGRIVSNGILLSSNNCPLSYRSVNVVDYKKAVLLFYEQNNIHAFKEIFINQYQFAVENYFL